MSQQNEQQQSPEERLALLEDPVYQENETLYINNLNEKVRIDDLKQCLQDIFQEFGTVIAVHAKQNVRMKGQAFIVFDDIQGAKLAKEAMSNIELFGKPIRIQYAKDKSNQIAKRNPNFKERSKKVELLQNQTILQQLNNKRTENQQRKKEKQKLLSELNGTGIDKQPTTTTTTTTNNKQVEHKTIQPPKPQLTAQPHNILFVEGLSKTITQQQLVELFSQYTGFKEVRLIGAKKVAFVEYEDEFKSGVALQELFGKDLGDCTLQINYANK